jgi:hypothetical protein
MRPRNLSLLALPVAALAIAGCGGGGGSSTSAPTTAATTTTTSALTKEELISRGDSICAEVNAAVGTVGAGSEEGTSQVGQVADLYIGMVESLKGIGTPEDSAGYSEFISAGEELAQAESDAKLADERGDSAALGEAETRATSALESFESAAESYGFKECGREPSAPTPTTGSAGEPPSTEESEVEETVEPEVEAAPEEVEEIAPETGGGAGAGAGEAPAGGEGSGGSSGGVGPG